VQNASHLAGKLLTKSCSLFKLAPTANRPS
jgi:hypothetical protein